MIQIKRLVPFFLVAIFLSSCAFHAGVISSGNASVSSENFRVAGFGYGYAKTVHVFGIGGHNKHALVMDAKRDMVVRYPLKKGQMYGQTTLDYRRLFVLPFVVKTSLFMSSDIIDFNTTNQDSLSGAYSKFGENYRLLKPDRPLKATRPIKNAKVISAKNLVRNENYKYPDDGRGPMVRFRISPSSYGEGELFNDNNGLLEIRSQNLNGKVNTVLKSKYDLLEFDETGNLKD